MNGILEYAGGTDSDYMENFLPKLFYRNVRGELCDKGSKTSLTSV